MDKIKKIFKHGDKDTEDDAVAHEPSPHAELAAKTALADAYGAPSASQQLQTKPDVDKKEHGIVSQITNPDGRKHDDVRFGETATVVPGTTLHRLQDVGGRGSNMSVLSGIEGPYASNADKSLQATASSSTAGTGASKLGHGADGSDTTALSSVQPGTALTTDQPLMAPSTTSTQPQTESSHVGRDAAPGGAAATDIGGAAYAASKDHSNTAQSPATTGLGQQTSTSSTITGTPKDDVSAATYTGRSFPLSNDTPRAPETGSLAGGSVKPDPSTSIAGDSSHLGRDAAIGTGIGASALAASGISHDSKDLAAYEKEHEPKLDIAAATYTARSYPVGGSSADQGRSFLPLSTQSVPPLGGHKDDEKPVEGYVHHTPGPHATDIANVLDPHVPGEFPTEEGLDPHAVTTTASVTDVAPRDQPIIGQSSSKPAVHNTESSGGLGAAAGAAGLGTVATSMAAVSSDTDRSSASHTSQQPLAQTLPSSERHPSELMGMPTDSTAPQPASDRNAVRHASISAGTAGAGAAAVGAVAYEANKRDQPSDIGFSSGSPPKEFISRPVEPVSSSASARRPSQTSRAAPPPPVSGTNLTSNNAPHPSELMSRPINEQNQTESHIGRDAALGVGAGLGLGAAGYEARKNYEQPSTIPATQPLASQSQGSLPSSSAIGHGDQDPPIMTTTNHRLSQSSGTAARSSGGMSEAVKDQQQHYYGRDAAVGAGGVGVAGVGAHELTKHEEDKHATETTGESSEHQHKEHNKLHKRTDPRSDKYVPTEEEEKKPSLLKRILHPHSSKEKNDTDEPKQPSSIPGMPSRAGAGTISNLSKQEPSNDGKAAETHSGLPTNVDKSGPDAV
ncbi:Hypothetical protein R9X50_00616700 [Acrodontium crateriforme]|uniref:Uncharacterized protein n=1 Tax=Acrodontium crateriforme TaxID=150365 RepID=A0AAQ3M984_9PEZI|nr:Hypothetical protein R9X50_00616700 [Acrodontium crateriforme]